MIFTLTRMTDRVVQGMIRGRSPHFADPNDSPSLRRDEIVAEEESVIIFRQSSTVTVARPQICVSL